MPRIRTIKPDFWKDHRLATSLSRDARLLYIGMWNFADDHGVLEGPAERIKAEIFPYETLNIKKLLSELIHSKRLIEYQVGESFFFWLTKLNKHQKLDRPRDSNLPMPSDEIINNHLKSIEISSVGDRDKEGIRKGEGGGVGEIPLEVSPSVSTASPQNGWGTPDALVALYNTATPDECPSVEKFTIERRKKAKIYLSQFPDKQFWIETFEQIRSSPFLRGLNPKPGHETFVASFDWLLSKGSKDQVENCVKVYEGKYGEKS